MLHLWTVHDVWIISTPKAQNPYTIGRHGKTGQGINERYHDRIVRPDSAVNKCVATVLEWLEKGWSRRCSVSDLCHPLAGILLKIRVMRGFENVDLTIAALERGDTQPRLRFAEFSVAESVTQNPHQRLSVVTELEILAGVSQATLRRSDNPASDGREDFASAINVKVAQVRCLQTGGKADGNDSAGRGSGSEVKVSRHRRPFQVAVLQSCKESGREYPTDAAASNREDTIERIRKFLSSGQGRGTRRHLSALDDRFGE